MTKCFLISFVVFIVTRCSVGPEEPGPVEPDGSTCENACANVIELGCDGAKGSPGEDEVFGTDDDRSCVQVCKNVTSDGFVSLDNGCVATAEDCEEVEECSE